MTSSVTKGPISEQDLQLFDGGDADTFSRDSSTGETLTLRKVGVVVDALMSYGGGVNFTQATISAAITAVGTRQVILRLRPNSAGGWAISTALAIPANIDIDMPTGSYFTYSDRKSVV